MKLNILNSFTIVCTDIKGAKIEQMGPKKAKPYKLASSTMTCIRACRASVGWDPITTQLISPISPQLSSHKAQLNRMLEMRIYFCKVMPD